MAAYYDDMEKKEAGAEGKSIQSKWGSHYD
jgi:hypothetical protein